MSDMIPSSTSTADRLPSSQIADPAPARHTSTHIAQRVQSTTRVRKGQRRHRESLLGAQTEPLAAGYEDLHARALPQKSAKLVSCVDDLFEIVEQQQHVLLLQMLDKRVQQRLPRDFT